MGVVAQQLSLVHGGRAFTELHRHDRERLGVAARRRRWRVWWLGWTRAVLMLATIAVPATLAVRGELQDVGLPVTDAVEWVLDLLPGYSGPRLGEATTGIAAVVSIAIVAFVTFVLLQWLWRWWSYVETHQVYRRLAYEGLPLQAFVLAAALLLTVEVAVMTALGHASGIGAGLRDTGVVAFSVAVAALLVVGFGDRLLELLWRGLPRGRSLIGPPSNVTSGRLALVAVVTSLVVFPAYALEASARRDVGWIGWALLASVALLLAVGVSWNTAPVYELRRRGRRRAYGGDVNLAQLRHAGTDADQRALLRAAADEVVETLDAAGRAIDDEQHRRPELGEATRWRHASAVAHDAARDAVDVAWALAALGEPERGSGILLRGAARCARAAVAHIEAAGLDADAAQAVLEPMVRHGPRRDRKIARKALRRVAAAAHSA
jgi:hypothetical protein